MTEKDNKVSAQKKPWYKALLAYFAQLFKDMGNAIKDKPSIIFGILIAFPGIFLGLFIDKHYLATNGLGTEADASGFIMFAMVMAGCISMYNGFGVATNRRLSSSIKSAICCAVILACGAVWIYFLASSQYLWESKYAGNAVTSMICVIISMCSSVIGVVGSFIFYDRNYKKD